MSKPLYQITKHPIGSLREIWATSWPLMLATLSWTCMYFSDRIILAHHSVQAMNGAAFGGLAAWAMTCFPVAILETTEVFVGRANGGGFIHKVGNAVWQMLWFAVIITPFFWLLSYLLSPLFFSGNPNVAAEYSYYATSILFSPFFFLFIALSGFSIGIGKMKMVTYSMVVANCLNIGLDFVFIFGWGPIPSFGCEGAAYATGISLVVQAIILGIFFFNSINRKNYQTTNFHFDLKLLKESLSIAIPSAVGRTMEIIAHLVFFRIMIVAGEATMTLVTVIQSLFILLSFLIDGLMKGAMAIFSNLIGASQYKSIPKVLLSALRLHTITFFVIAALMYAGCEVVFNNFFSNHDFYLLAQPDFISVFKKSAMWMTLYFLFDGFSWVLVGLLTANKDTKFVMYASAALNWIAFVLPIYIFIGQMKHTADFAWMILTIYNGMNFLVYLSRYYFKTRREHLELTYLANAA